MKLGIPVELYWLHNSNLIGSHFSPLLDPESAMLALVGELLAVSKIPRMDQDSMLGEIITSLSGLF